MKAFTKIFLNFVNANGICRILPTEVNLMVMRQYT